jgi:hypothetical protein
MKNLKTLLLGLLLSAAVFAQAPVYQGQGPTRPVDTTTRPIEKQVRKTFSFPSAGVSFSNRFDGARLNDVTQTGPDSFTVTILPENEPINMSPWYAFRVWSKRKKEISVRFSYPESARHRYTPLLSRDGLRWKAAPDTDITEEDKGAADFGPNSRPKSIVLRLKVDPKPLWISAQELNTSKHVYGWMDRLAKRHRLRVETIGKSKEGRPIKMMTVGNRASKNNVLVISRQHPPEVTGYFAMQAFVESLLDRSKLARDFRRDWAVFVVPLVNPDGVDEGHWRHNAGGIDLNRDWTLFNQPEGKVVSDFLNRRRAESGGKFYFGIDFHSTWDDIYYPMDRKFESNMTGLVHQWLDGIKASIPGYNPNIQANARLEPAIVSRNYFLNSHGMEAIVFEIGDNTPREFIKKKGSVGANELMRLLISRKAEQSAAAGAAAGR